MFNKNKINRQHLRGFALLLLAIYIVVAGVFLYQSNPHIRNTIALATTVQPETFTELYFEDHLNLPSQIVPGQENSFKFTLHNLENKDMEYTYEVYVELDGEKILINKNIVFVKNNEYKTVEQKLILPNYSSKAKVVVYISNINQKIAFWMKEEGAK